jgi:hypothetical protein
MGNAMNNIFVNYMRATEIETKGTSCPQYFTYCCIRRQSQSINKVPTRFDVYIKGNRNDIFAARGADIAILTGFMNICSPKSMDLLVIISNLLLINPCQSQSK